ncbi:MAG: DEAD/DEAH box helicase [Ktedonobacteraceae bacterium]|nr:DEAD/DEAH box helicase [Ktedonobacteraceae bacterium]
MSSFNDFLLQPATRAVLANMEITEPTPIQAEAIPALLAGNDVVGQSATGSGKTLAYGIPLVERLARDKRTVQALILVPTRELAIQVNTVLSKLATGRRLSTALLVGGRPYNNQISALRYGSQIVIGTPGRVKDHLDRGTLVLNQLRICVLDEADQMLDSGFAPAIEEILTTTPETRQMALFSATIPAWVATLQQKFLKNPVNVAITPAVGAQSTIEQIAYQVPQDQKMAALCTLLHSTEGESSLIFGKTKFGVEKLGKQLSKLGFTVGTLHGNKSQRAREEVLTAFRRGQVQTLLATNVAARGLDITGISQVINYELPESSELFTHRIGRTGRMGRQGKAITLLVPSDVPKWRRMARNLGQAVLLQKLAIDEDASTAQPIAKPETPITQAYEQNDERQSVHDRSHFSSGQQRDRKQPPVHDRSSHSAPGQQRDRRTRSTRESYAATDARQQRKKGRSSERPMNRPVWEPEGFTLPERTYAGKMRNDRKKAGKQTHSDTRVDMHEARSFPRIASRQTARKEFSAPSGVQRRRASVSKRVASR